MRGILRRIGTVWHAGWWGKGLIVFVALLLIGLVTPKKPATTATLSQTPTAQDVSLAASSAAATTLPTATILPTTVPTVATTQTTVPTLATTPTTGSTATRMPTQTSLPTHAPTATAPAPTDVPTPPTALDPVPTTVPVAKPSPKPAVSGGTRAAPTGRTSCPTDFPVKGNTTTGGHYYHLPGGSYNQTKPEVCFASAAAAEAAGYVRKK